MNEPTKILGDALLDEIKRAVREELHALMAENGQSQKEDRLLTAEEAAPLLNVTRRWLYRHSRRLPFARRLSRKALRFSEVGIHRWLAAKNV